MREQQSKTGASSDSFFRRLRLLFLDALVCLLTGLAAGTVAGLVLWAAGAAAGGAKTGMTAARSGLMLTGALMLLAGAAGFLKGNHLPEDTFRLPEFFSRFLARPGSFGTSSAEAGHDTDYTSGSGRDHDEDRDTLLPILRIISRRASLILIGSGVLLVSAAADYLLLRY